MGARAAVAHASYGEVAGDAADRGRAAGGRRKGLVTPRGTALHATRAPAVGFLSLCAPLCIRW